MTDDYKTETALCPHCEVRLRGRAARTLHVPVCADKTPEEREHYRRFRKWPMRVVG